VINARKGCTNTPQMRGKLSHTRPVHPPLNYYKFNNIDSNLERKMMGGPGFLECLSR